MATRTTGEPRNAAAAAPQDQAATIRVEMAARRASVPLSSRPHQAGVDDIICSEDRRQFALLTGQWNFPAFLRRIVEGLRLPGNGVKEGGIRGRKEMKGNAIIIAKQAQPVSIS